MRHLTVDPQGFSKWFSRDAHGGEGDQYVSRFLDIDTRKRI
jgi:hypothetical protein